ncbi:squalene synthase HpnC [Novosphingobium sp. FSY-8]|uniref:Squalene synthase HpnC n=1 Tax=Novosphingobium ovatum TaxID=1908523 RepID=A0ABW9XHA7_9SPHN|nr:squalene synthase HpnC [Novosphingobium ovatum]NBC37849.1 squalene synthase HpnC [Novosphingobium ovatum]
MTQAAPNDIADLASGKDHNQENFPVASWLLRPDARAPVMAYYRFARAADDIADNPDASAADKLRLLRHMRKGLTGVGAAEAMELAHVCRNRGISVVHAMELLDAFEQDCRQSRYEDWDGLIAYCRKSAMPVGRYVLDVHGETRDTWPANDALCAALQIINHLQDCGKDYRVMDRVYIPLPLLHAAGLDESALGGARADRALLDIIHLLTEKTQGLLRQSAGFAAQIRDRRLASEVAVIHALAQDLCTLLLTRDPLVGGVHHSKRRAGWLALGALGRYWLGQLRR